MRARIVADFRPLRHAVERACIRQRNLWVVTAVVIGLSALAGIVETPNLFLF